MSLRKTFDQLDIYDLSTLISMQINSDFSENNDFYDGDHWRFGKGFKSVLPPPSHWTTTTIQSGLKLIFTSKNFIREGILRRRDACLSRPVRIEVGKGEEAAKEKQRILTDWYRRKKVVKRLKDASVYSSLHGKTFLRLRIPPNRLDKNLNVVGDTMEEILDNIFLEHHKRDQATVVIDEDSGERVGIVYFERLDSRLPVFSGTTPDGPTGELSFLDRKTGKTVIRIVDDGSVAGKVQRLLGTNKPNEVQLDLGGLLTIHEVDAGAYITKQVRDNQMGFNTTLTHLLFNNHESNFVQRIFMNAMPPGTTVIDEATGETKFTVTALERGVDKDIWLTGIKFTREDGSFEILTPSVTSLKPESAQRFLDTMAICRMNLRSEMRQMHMELTDDATSTGEARIQASNDHKSDVESHKEVIEEAAEWALETAWRMGEHFLKIIESKRNRFPVSVNCIVDLGSITSSARSSNIQEKQEDIRSRRTAMTEAGITDPDAEEAQIEKERQTNIKYISAVADAIKKLRDSGADEESVEKLTGIKVKFEEPPEPEPQNVPITSPEPAEGLAGTTSNGGLRDAQRQERI